MPDEIRSIRIESNNICYGPEPGADDEVEQYLTISSTGRVWFSARNYQQYCNSKDYCRKKQTSIDKWKAEFLLRLIDNISENMSFVTDVGSYDLEIRYSNDTKRRISGSLIGGVYSHAYGEENNVDVTRLIRRYIPVYGLWAFDSSTSPDYEGKKAVFLFAEAWEKFFKNPDLGPEECGIFLCLLRRLKELTRKKQVQCIMKTIRTHIQYWIDYKGTGDEYRRAHDLGL